MLKKQYNIHRLGTHYQSPVVGVSFWTSAHQSGLFTRHRQSPPYTRYDVSRADYLKAKRNLLGRHVRSELQLWRIALNQTDDASRKAARDGLHKA